VTTVLVIVAWLLGLVAIVATMRRLRERRRGRERAFEPETLDNEPHDAGIGDGGTGLRRQLYLAGFTGPNAVGNFLAFAALALAVGLGFALAVRFSGYRESLGSLVTSLPANVGDMLLPLGYCVPWVFAACVAALPWLVVRAARRRRSRLIEQDLPITLELLATLSESGLAFDSALDRILTAWPSQRPLAEELRTFQMELLAGRPRVMCLRRLSRRVDLLAFTVVVSALVQAEQIGSGVADVLQRQANELRNRRLENALVRASSLPVKLLVPLVVCFIPGILVATLGPTFYQFFQVLESILRQRGL
jgi:tight adherence protein C